MLRRTLVLFTALTLMGLAMVLAYAWLNVDSARNAVGRAEELLRRGRSADAVELLYDAEQSSGGKDQDLLRRILRSRYQAHDQLNNFKHARADIERLMALGDRSLDLDLDRVRILRGDGDHDLARTEALRLVEANPDSAPCLQAAGECVQFAYQSELKKILDGLLGQLPSEDSLRARKLMLLFLYRSADDVEAQTARAQFDELIRDRMPDHIARSRLDSRLTQIVHGVAQSVDFYRRALETGVETSPAFRGLSWTLIQQGRLDDAALLSQIYLLRFDSALSGFAADRGAELHAQQGRHAEALRIVDLWRRGRTCKEQYELLDMERNGGLHAAVEAWTRGWDALFELARVEDLRARVAQFFELEAYLGNKFGTWTLLVHDRYMHGLLFLADKQWDAALGRLEEYVKTDDRLARRSVGESDRFADVMLLMHHAAKQAGKMEKQLDVLSQWIRERPGDARPYDLRARDYEEAGQLGMALQDLRACVRLEPQSDGFMTALLAVAERIHGLERLGSADLLQSMLRFPGTNLFPLPPDPVLYLGVAELALRQGRADIAVENARAAMSTFPRSPRLRRTYVRACLLAGDPRQAITEMEAFRAISPPTPEDLELLLEARKKSQRPFADVERDLLVTDASLKHAPTLMRHGLRRGAYREVLAIGDKFLATHGDQGDALLSMAMSELALGNEERALTLFGRIPEAAPERLPAVERSLFLRARSGPPEECSRLAAELVRLAGDSGEILVRAGMRLADLGAPEAAVACLLPILEDGRFVKLRTAKLLTRMAEILLSSSGDDFGDHPRAEILLEGALSMEEGGRAKVLLATLYAAEGRVIEAEEVYSFPQTDASIPPDVHVGLLIRLGRRAAAVAHAEQILASRPADYVMLALRAIASISLADGKPVILPGKSTGVSDLDQLVLERPMQLLDILSLPRLGGFGNRLSRAETLLQESRGNPWAPFFIARARELQGDWKNAIGFLSKLLADEPRFYPAYDEAYRLQADHDPAALSDPALMLEYVKPVLSGLPGMSAGMVSRTIYLAALRELASGDLATASRWKMVAWMMDPRSFAVGRDLALEALAGGRTEEALAAIELLWDRVPDGERLAFHELYFQAALALIRDTSDVSIRTSLRARARARAEKVLRETGIFGYALHFLADTDPRGAESIPAARLTEHIRYLVDQKRSPAGDLTGIERSLRLLVSRTGPKAVLPLLDELLTADPSVFDLWILRAQLLAREGRPGEAATSLRWILDYVEHAPVARELVGIVAAADALSARDEKLIRRNVPAEPTSPEDRSTLALIAWRRADHVSVVRLLSGHPSALRSIELYARATALIARGTKDDLELAAEDLDEIARRGAESPHGQEAGFLAHQLRKARG